MARITLRQLLDHAAEYDYGVPAFNINNMEQVLAILNAASEVDAPVILQASRGPRRNAGAVPRSLRTVQHRRQGQPHQDHQPRADGEALRQRRS